MEHPWSRALRFSRYPQQGRTERNPLWAGSEWSRNQGNGAMKQQRVQECGASSSHEFNPSLPSEAEGALPPAR